MSSSGLLSKNAKLGYSATGTSPITYADIPDLQSISEIFGDVETVEVTTLADNRRRYIPGLANSEAIECKFLYDNSAASSSFRVVKGLEGSLTYWQITLPDNTKIAFSGYVSVKIDEVAIGEALTFTASLTINSDMTVTNPA